MRLVFRVGVATMLTVLTAFVVMLVMVMMMGLPSRAARSRHDAGMAVATGVTIGRAGLT